MIYFLYVIILGRINSLEWNPIQSGDGSCGQNYGIISNYNEELVTAGQDCLVKFHDLSEALVNTSTGPQTCDNMTKIHSNSSSFRTVVPVWKARYVKQEKLPSYLNVV